jgi:serine/threonine protein kinase/Flp pilus assembly protein TadD
MDLLARKTFCETCGSSLEVDMPSGFCPACLLTTALEGPDAPSSGSRIEDYELLNEIARGGMGIVYRAQQRTPSRIVALKMILPVHLRSSGAVNRFRTEAEAAASLDHECILPVYSVGEQDGTPFYSMKFAEGGPLSARIENYRTKPHETAALIAKLARAIAYAHQRTILHRDLKPGNILFDGAGKPYVSDFGLAKWLRRECDLTQTLAILGTPFYMAPEQAADSRAVGAAADMYSLGAILYQMLTGRPPVSGETPMEVLRRAAEQAPRRPRLTNRHVPRDLETICLKCLEKEPASRYSSAVALAEDLERFCAGRTIQARPTGLTTRMWRWTRRNPAIAGLAAASVALVSLSGILWREHVPRPPNGLAVLPFKNLSADPENAYFADGIQQEILTRLSKIGDLKVISRTSAENYKGPRGDLRQIAKQLGVEYVVEGSVQKNGDAVRISAELIKVADDSHLWADSFDRKITDILSVESEIAKTIAEQLQAKLTNREKQVIAARPTDNPQAYEAYLRGLVYAGRPGYAAENVLAARNYFKQAVGLDPKFALAWAALARIISVGYGDTLPPTAATREEARRAAETAVALQPDLGEAFLALAQYHNDVLNDYGASEHFLERARQLLPNDSHVTRLLAALVRQRGNWQQSESYFSEAKRLDPRNPQLIYSHAASLMFQRRFDEARRELEQVLNIIPDDTLTLVREAGIAQAQGDLKRAAALLDPLPLSNSNVRHAKCYQSFLERNPSKMIPQIKELLSTNNLTDPVDRAMTRAWLGWLEEVMGDRAAALENWRQARSELEPYLKEQEPQYYFLMAFLAFLNASLGDKTAAFNLAERGTSIVPVQKSALFGPMMIEVLARVAALTGDRDRAIASLQALLDKPYGGPLAANPPMTPALLRLDPMFDSLRAYPRFRRMIDSH